MKFVFTYLKKYYIASILAPIFMGIMVFTELEQPTLISKIVDIGIKNNDLNYIINTGIKMLGYAGLSLIAGILTGIFASIASQNAATDLRNDLYVKFQSLSYKTLDELETGNIITRLTNDVGQVQNIMLISLRILIRAPLMAIGSIIMSIKLAPQLSYLIILLVPLILSIVFFVSNRAYPFFMTLQKSLDKVNSVIQENLSGMRVVKSFVQEKQEINKFKSSNSDLSYTTIKANKTISVMMPLITLFINLAIVFALYIGGLLTGKGVLQIGMIIAFINYLTRLSRALAIVGMMFMRLSRAQASINRLQNLLSKEPIIKNSTKALTKTKLKGKIEFKNVTFSYSKNLDDAVLKNISFTINPGQTTAILGATGSGKSSLLSLIPRLYDINAGNIYIDDISITDIDIKDLRNNISFAHQQTILFSGSITENLYYGKIDATITEQEEACEIAQISDFINKSHDKYDSRIGQRGINLSGGQKQRLAIARAIIKKPPILLFDDTTSAVDIKTEYEIQKALKKNLKNLTCIFVAQRISSVLDSDNIILLDNGMISAIGNHSELIKSSALYRDIYTSQLGTKEVM